MAPRAQQQQQQQHPSSSSSSSSGAAAAHDMMMLPPPPAATMRSESDFQNLRAIQNKKKRNNKNHHHHQRYYPSKPGKAGEKQGHACFGCCCDMRRGVIVANSLAMVLALIEIIAASTLLALYDDIQKQQQQQDEEEQPDWFLIRFDNHEITKPILGVALGLGIVSLFFLAAGIRGAKQFSTCWIGTAMFYHVVNLIVSLAFLNPLGVLLAALFLYPHVLFYTELRSGVMHPDTYEDQERKTCCV